jgi:hypothetical protein
VKVRLLEDAPGSPDGVTVNQYAKVEVYEVTSDLGTAFVAHKLAERVRTIASALRQPVG